MSTNNASENFILRYKPIQRLVEGIGGQVLNYVGKDKVCVIGLGDDGVFYGEGLYVWLKKKGVKADFTTMDYDCSGLEESKVAGTKIIVADNDIITGTAYKSVMETMRSRQKALKFKDIKYAVLCDRTRLADFSVEDYMTTAGSEVVKMDSIDFKILNILAQNGRASFADIATETGLTVSGAKKRVEKIMDDEMVRVRGMVNIRKFYSISALIELEVDLDRLTAVIERARKSQLVYLILKVYNRYNLIIGVVASNLGQINEFIEKNIGNDPGIRNVLVHAGEVPILPDSK